MATAITKAPTQTVTNLSWSRTGNKYTLSWKVPSNLTSESNCARATNLVVWFKLSNSQPLLLMENVVDHVKVSTSTTSYSWTIPDAWAKNLKMYKLQGGVASYNVTTSKGINYPHFKWTDWCTVNINAPAQPSIATPVWDAEGSTVKCTFTGKKAERDRPRRTYHMARYRRAVINGVTTPAKGEYALDWQSDALGWDTNDTLTYSNTVNDTSERDKLVLEGDYVKYVWKVYGAGINGNSATSSSYIYIRHPAKPAIQNVAHSTLAKGCNVTIQYQIYDKNGVISLPSDSHQLYVAYAKKKGQITEDDWKAIGDEIETPGSGFFISDSEITPEIGQHVYIRCKSIYQIYETWSDIVDIDDAIQQTRKNNNYKSENFKYYKAETGQDDAPATQVSIVETKAGDDNESVEIVIGYPASDVYDACEISYSTDTKAWESTSQPDTYQMPDKPWQDTTSKSTSYKYTSSIKISNLDEATKYYIRARRYSTADEKVRTNWSTRAEQTTNQNELTGLVLSGPEIARPNHYTSFSWEFPSELKQTAWYLFAQYTDTNGTVHTDEIEHGNGSITSCKHVFEYVNTYKVYVMCYFDNNRSMKSDSINVDIIRRPFVKFITEPADPLTTLPANYKLQAVDGDDNPRTDVNLFAKILSHGSLKQNPDGFEQQYYRDVVASFEGTNGVAEYTINDGSVFWDNTYYKIEVTTEVNGFKDNDPTVSGFYVNYNSTVTAPSDENVVITPTDTKGATIQVNNLEDGQTWDLYRATKDERNFLIKGGLASGETVEDKFAPYCSKTNSQYIVLVKNANAQTDYRYYDYVADYDVLRFDWDNKFVELPYNIEIEDETDKQFEQQIYLDGTQKGAWGASVIRQASLSTDTIYITDEDTQRKVRDLARYQGAVFVRTPLGQAYTANVEVNKISKPYDSKVMAVSFDCTEIDMVSAFEAIPYKEA